MARQLTTISIAELYEPIFRVQSDCHALPLPSAGTRPVIRSISSVLTRRIRVETRNQNNHIYGNPMYDVRNCRA